jgi:hypothetical protein
MQARLSFIRFPSFLVATVFALLAALILGGVLGYTLKPTVLLPGRTQVVILHEQNTSGTAEPCLWIDHQKTC